MNLLLIPQNNKTATLFTKSLFFSIICALALSVSSFAATRMQIIVDATELPRKLLHTRISLEMAGDSVSLLYPKWIPASHGPSGPVKNLIGLSITDAGGDEIRWKRDWADYFRFYAFPSDDAGQCTVSLSYICNQGGATFGFSTFGIIDWNCVVLYPEGIPISEIEVDLKLILPSDWQYGSALPYKKTVGDTLVFETVTFEELVDMPLICGVDFRTVEIATTEQAKYYLHIVAQHEDDLPDVDDDSTWARFEKLVHEAEALFTRTHFNNYHFLLALSDSAGYGGREHRNSSLNTIKANAMHEDSWYESGVPELLAHEMVHAWCGKYRRPVGMATSDYQIPKELDLLWMYEGLTKLLGEVLSARAGFLTYSEFKEELGYFAGYLLHQKGRRWQPLRDTQVATHLLWGRSKAWRFHRRRVDYYREGALLWLEIDARIRTATDGEKTLDDFCGRFFSDGDPKAHYVPFQLDDVISVLNDLAPQPWDSLLDARLNFTQQEYDTTAIHWSGYQLAYTDKKSKAITLREKYRKYHDLYESAGLSIKDDGSIVAVIPDGPADMAGLYAGVKIIAVNGKRYTYKRLENAIRRSVKNDKITLLTQRSEDFVETSIKYNGGLRYFTLIPLEGKKDWLKEIAKPRVE